MKRTPRLLFFLFLAGICCKASLAQTPDLPATVAKLRATRISEDSETEVAPELRSLLKELKHDLRDLALETMNSTEQRAASPAQLESAIKERLKKLGIVEEPRQSVEYNGPNSLTEETWHPYGQITSIRVETPSSHPELLAVVTTLNIDCGQDSSLHIFSHTTGTWKLILEREADDYARIDGAIENLQYSVSPPDEKGGWFVLVGNSSPWCTSCWNGLHYQVLRPTSNAEQPKIVLDRNEGFYRCNEEGYKLVSTAHGFALAYQSFMSHDADLWSRISVDRFQLDGDTASRLPPPVQDPVAFVDQWLDLKDEEANLLVVPTARASSTEWRRQFQKSVGIKSVLGTEYTVLQQCNGSRQRWLVGLALDKKDANDVPAAQFYFEVIDTRHGMLLKSMSGRRIAGCPGEGKPNMDEERLKLPELSRK